MSSASDMRAGQGLTAGFVLALVVGQLGVHAAMAGVRMTASLQVLREGYSAALVGVLMALFAAAPVVLAWSAGRLADRHGYHFPVKLATASALVGVAVAWGSTFMAGWAHFIALCIGAAFTGAGANMGMLAIQRAAAQAASNPTEQVRVFSWLAVAPSFANVIGLVAAGYAIDWGGFAWAYATLLLLPMLTLWSLKQVPHGAVRPSIQAGDSPESAWSLLKTPGLKRLLFVNWLMSTCWDVHAFAVPILGHERGFTASTIGLILGTFTLSVTLVRLGIPLVAKHMRERVVMRFAMLGTATTFALYPLVQAPWQMGLLAVILGVTLGGTQPMVMVMLHHVTPDGRHGESIAFRSIAINLSSTAMPLIFGMAGVAVGVGSLFWMVGGAVAAGSWLTRGLRVPAKPSD